MRVTTTGRRSLRADATAVAVVLAVVLVARGLEGLIPGVSATVWALVLAAVVANLTPHMPGQQRVAALLLGPGLRLLILAFAVGLSTEVLAALDARLAVAVVAVVVLGLACGTAVARALHLDADHRLLLGSGAGICGATAVAVVSSVTDVDRDQLGPILGGLFVFNSVALLAVAGLAATPLSEVFLGLASGLGVHDTSTAVAAGFTAGTVAGELATVAKMFRTLGLAPVVVLAAVLVAVRQARTPAMRPAARVPSLWEGAVQALRSVPWFIWLFAVTVGVRLAGYLDGFSGLAGTLGRWLMPAIVAVIGLSLRRERLTAGGGRLLTAMLVTCLLTTVGVVLVVLALW